MASRKTQTSRKKRTGPWHIEIVEGEPKFWSGKILWHMNIVGANGEPVFTDTEPGTERNTRSRAKDAVQKLGLKVKERAKG